MKNNTYIHTFIYIYIYITYKPAEVARLLNGFNNTRRLFSFIVILFSF